MAMMPGVSWAAESSPASEVVPAGDNVAMTLFQTRPGQFEVVATDGMSARMALLTADEVWSALAGPLGLPGHFSSAVIVRLVPAQQWHEQAEFRTFVEPGGLVSVRLRFTSGLDLSVLRRALVQALLLRQAVAWHGADPRLVIPLWLEIACANVVLVRAQPAMMDALQVESATMEPPLLETLLRWERGGIETRVREAASFWLLGHLQAESVNNPRWFSWLRAVLVGVDPIDATQAFYKPFFSNATERELWWQVGFHHQRRQRLLPVQTAADSRIWLIDRSRWIALRDGHEEVLGLEELPALRGEPWVKLELNERLGQLEAQLGAIHPFYRNAALSLGRSYEAALAGKTENVRQAGEEFIRDAIDGRELEDVTAAALDALEKR